MKKSIFLLLTGFSLSLSQAQDITDALRYSMDNTNGTARYRALSGAFGALGGDLSSLNVNPAGSAIFANNQLAFTLNNNAIKNNADYFGTRTTSNKNNFDFNQAGGVFVFKNHDKKSDWTKFAFAINYENNTRFNNEVAAFGVNPTRSVDAYFLSYANDFNPITGEKGVALGIIKDNDFRDLSFQEQQAFMAAEGFVINPLVASKSNTKYTSNVPSGGNYYQESTVISRGNNGKVSFNLATSYKNKLYLGINLNTHFIDFTRSSSFYEKNDNPNSNMVDLKSLTLNNNLYTYGSGFSFQLGALLKVTDKFRAGLAYESPTWYRLNDELQQNLITRILDYSTSSSPGLSQTNSGSSQAIIDEPYRFRTPGKWTASLAYVFGKSGLISLDYGLKDYSSSQFPAPAGNAAKRTNSEISQFLNTSGELRVGAEYKIEAWSLRAGYRYEQSPYKNKITVGDLTGYSTGFGYSWGDTKLDFTFSRSERMMQQSFFNRGFTDAAKVNTTNNVVTASLVFEL